MHIIFMHILILWREYEQFFSDYLAEVMAATIIPIICVLGFKI